MNSDQYTSGKTICHLSMLPSASSNLLLSTLSPIDRRLHILHKVFVPDDLRVTEFQGVCSGLSDNHSTIGPIFGSVRLAASRSSYVQDTWTSADGSDDTPSEFACTATLMIDTRSASVDSISPLFGSLESTDCSTSSLFTVSFVVLSGFFTCFFTFLTYTSDVARLS